MAKNPEKTKTQGGGVGSNRSGKKRREKAKPTPAGKRGNSKRSTPSVLPGSNKPTDRKLRNLFPPIPKPA